MKKLLAIIAVSIMIATVFSLSANSASLIAFQQNPISTGLDLELFPPGMLQQSAQQNDQQNDQQNTPQPSGDPFTLSVSGNVYCDKIPVMGAEVSIYVNDVFRGKTVAGDLYMFQVPNVRAGDIIKAVAVYEGHTGTATKVVRSKNMYLDIKIASGESFLRRAIEIIPTEEELKQAEELEKQQQEQQQQQQQQTQSQQPSSGTSQGFISANTLNEYVLPNAWNNFYDSMSKKMNF